MATSQRTLPLSSLQLLLQLLLFLLSPSPIWAFVPTVSVGSSSRRLPTHVQLGFLGGSSSKADFTIPKSPSDRDRQAIDGIKAAINAPKTASLPLIECEFPPLNELNKLGDGSLRSANLVDEANLAFSAKLVRGLAPLPFVGPKVWLLASSSASSTFMNKARKTVSGAAGIMSLRDGIPQEIGPGDICIIVSPSSRQDYQLARQLAGQGTVGAVVLVNGITKDQKSVNNDATMAFYLKPLTYNSQVVGYLGRKYPSNWSTVDLISKRVLASYTDSEILFGQTNTPDLRDPGKRVQKAVDDRAIAARIN